MSKTQEKIVQMFDEIAPTYDRANRILSMGVDISWRKKACDSAFRIYDKKSIERVADVACGTGDMMDFGIKEPKKNGIECKEIIGIDPSSGMLKVGKEKFPNFKFLQSEATLLPLEDESVDILSISYGIRNVVKRVDAFKEFARVLKKGGLVVILEFTKDEKKGILQSIKNFYLNKILPFLGGLISKNYEAYRYLPNSIEGFLTSQMLIDELDSVGFDKVYTKAFSMDISTLVIARKR